MSLLATTYRSRFVLDRIRTIEEHTSLMSREEMMAWVKDVAAGAGILIFIAGSFVLASHAVLLAG
jgi:hypothetical protein